MHYSFTHIAPQKLQRLYLCFFSMCLLNGIKINLQIPTIPSSSQAMTSAFSSAKNALNAVTELAQSKELKNALVSFNKTMNALTNRVDSKNLTQLIISASNAFTQADSTFTHVNKKIDPVVIDLEEILDKTRNALQSFTDLTDYLSRHPESLIQGKKGSR